MKVTLDMDIALSPEVLKLPRTVVDTVGILSLVKVVDINKEHYREVEYRDNNNDPYLVMFLELPGVNADEDGQYMWEEDTIVRTDIKLSKERHMIVNNIFYLWLKKNDRNVLDISQKITDAYLSLL